MPIIGHSIVLSLLFLLSATGLAATDEKGGHKHGSTPSARFQKTPSISYGALNFKVPQ